METEKLLHAIREILLDRRQIAIPGFGGFVLVYQPSAMEEEKQQITSPSHMVSFNPSLNQDDGVLKEVLGKSFSVPEKDQDQVVSDFVQQLDKRLTLEGKLVFPGIGTVRIDESGSQIFEAERKKQVLPADYGLPEVVDMGKPRGKPVRGRSAATTTSKDKKERKGRRSLKLIVWIGVPAAVVVIVLGMAGYLQDWFSADEVPPRQTVEAGSGKKEQSPAKQTILPADSLNRETPQEEKTAARKAKPAKEAVSEAVTGKETGEYYLIAGSFREQDNALRLMQKLSQKNYSTEIHRAPNGYYRVSIGSYQTKERAIEAHEEQKTKVSGVWVWRKR